MSLLKHPHECAILSDVKMCDSLVFLLSLDSIKHWQLIATALHILYSISLSSDCSLAIVRNKNHMLAIGEFLR